LRIVDKDKFKRGILLIRNTKSGQPVNGYVFGTAFESEANYGVMNFTGRGF